MLQTERAPDGQVVIETALRNLAARLYVSHICIVESYNAMNGTVNAQPVTRSQFTDPQGRTSWVNLPVLINVPLINLAGGNFAITCPIQPGDECLVIFQDRCLDGWWQSGGVQNQARLRTHDLSDGIAIVGPRSVPRAIPNVSTSSLQIRTIDGSAYFELAPGGVVNIVAPGGINITGPVQINGNLAVSGEGTFGPTAIPMTQHLHVGVQSGPANTGTPIP